MADEIIGTASYGFRVQGLSFSGVSRDEAQAKISELVSGLEALGAEVVLTSYPRFEPDSPSVASTYIQSESGRLEVVTKHTVEDFLATSAERFKRFPVKSFWEALIDHTLLAHEGMDGSSPIPLRDLDTYDVPDKKQFYVGMEACSCALRGYGYSYLDPRSLIRVWEEWDRVRPGRLYRFGARKREFLGSLARQLESDLGSAGLL